MHLRLAATSLLVTFVDIAVYLPALGVCDCTVFPCAKIYLDWTPRDLAIRINAIVVLLSSLRIRWLMRHVVIHRAVNRQPQCCCDMAAACLQGGVQSGVSTEGAGVQGQIGGPLSYA